MDNRPTAISVLKLVFVAVHCNESDVQRWLPFTTLQSEKPLKFVMR